MTFPAIFHLEMQDGKGRVVARRVIRLTEAEPASFEYAAKTAAGELARDAVVTIYPWAYKRPVLAKRA